LIKSILLFHSATTRGEGCPANSSVLRAGCPAVHTNSREELGLYLHGICCGSWVFHMHAAKAWHGQAWDLSQWRKTSTEPWRSLLNLSLNICRGE